MGVETLDVDESLYSILTMINNGTWQIIQRFPLQSALYPFKEKCPTIAVTVLVGAFPLREKCPTIAVTVLVGAFPLRDKCPTIAVTVFFFRRQPSH